MPLDLPYFYSGYFSFFLFFFLFTPHFSIRAYCNDVFIVFNAFLIIIDLRLQQFDKPSK